jgi:hypothetical protein
MNIDKVLYNADTSEVIVRKKLNRLRAPFSVIGPMTNVKVKSMITEDVFDLLDKVSKRAFSVFNNLKYNRSLTNNVCAYVSYAEMDKTDKETLSRNLTELKSVGLIRGVPKYIPDKDDSNKVHYFEHHRKTYIINPEFIRCRDHDEAEYLWNCCGGSE